MPNVSAVNDLGDYDIAADRLAIIDGEGMVACLWVLDLSILTGL